MAKGGLSGVKPGPLGGMTDMLSQSGPPKKTLGSNGKGALKRPLTTGTVWVTTVLTGRPLLPSSSWKVKL